jgi:hypothetical protein
MKTFKTYGELLNSQLDNLPDIIADFQEIEASNDIVPTPDTRFAEVYGGDVAVVESLEDAQSIPVSWLNGILSHTLLGKNTSYDALNIGYTYTPFEAFEGASMASVVAAWDVAYKVESEEPIWVVLATMTNDAGGATYLIPYELWDVLHIEEVIKLTERTAFSRFQNPLS